MQQWLRHNIGLAAELYGIDPASVPQLPESDELPELWRETFKFYDTLRFARLTHCLRQREPSELIADSILVFRLTDNDLHAALDAPLPDLPEHPHIKGLER